MMCKTVGMNRQNFSNELIQEGINTVRYLLYSYIKKFSLRSIMSQDDIEDMEQEGMYEMLKCIQKYNPDIAKFSTYVAPRIKGAYISYIQNEGYLRSVRSDKMIELLSEEIGTIFDTPDDDTDTIIDKLHLLEDDIDAIIRSMNDDDTMHEIRQSFAALPSVKLRIIISYYLLNKSVKDISRECGYQEDSGWIYKMKRQAVNLIQQKLKSKGYYIPSNKGD